MGAVQKAADQAALSAAEAPLSIEGEAQQKLRIVAGRTFIYSNGVWMDTAFDPDTMKTQAVAFLSKDYFRLLQAYPSLGAAFSLGERVIALADSVAYEVVAAESSVPALPPNQSPPDTPTSPAKHTAQSKEPKAPAAYPCLSGFLLLTFLFWSKFWR